MRAQRDRLQRLHLAAPIGGLNTVSSGVDMPATDSILSYNLIGAEYGLRSRLGWREWVTGLDGPVRSLLPFTGSTKDGGSNRLFACTETGIWDVSASTTAPTQVVTFGTNGPDAGWGVSTVFVTSAGHFLGYCDEANGYYVYAENVGTWIKVIEAAATDWKPGTDYLADDYVTNGGLSYRCTAPGKSVGSVWLAGHAYVANDVVIVDGDTYRCVKAGTSQGGPWAPATAYIVGQIVTNADHSYRCTKAGTSQVDVSTWTITTAYVVGQLVANGSSHYRCTKAGTSAGSGGPSGTGTAITDGTATWTFTEDSSAGPLGEGSAIQDGTAAWEFRSEAAKGPSGTGNSIADSTVVWERVYSGPSGTSAAISDGTATWAYIPAVSGVDPARFASVTAWKNRLLFVERDTGSAWYLPIGSLYGKVSRLNFGARFQHGGDLRGLWSLSHEGGIGPDDYLVAVSGGGDIVVYAGTDPSSASTFGLVNVWFVGSVPAGRRICTDNGGDLLVMSSTGIQSMSKLMAGAGANPGQYETGKIANLFNQLQASTSNIRGWAMRLHPQDACLMVLVPVAPNQATQQLVMSLSTRGWHQYRDLPMGVCAEPWGGTLYFGTEDGRVCVNDGYVDGVLLSDPNSYSPIGWSLLTAFSNLGVPNQKRVQLIRPTILSQGGAIPYQAQARYRWDLSEIGALSAAATASGAAWDSALWDQAIWGGSYQAQQSVFGAVGMGPEVAIALRGAASSRMTLTGIDVAYDAGGFL